MSESLPETLELTFLETLISAQNQNSDQQTLQLQAVRNLSTYLQARTAIFVLFDQENPAQGNKKILGPEDGWQSEESFQIKSSSLCSALPESLTLIDASQRQAFGPDPILYSPQLPEIQTLLLAPLRVAGSTLGAIAFINPLLNWQDEKHARFLQLMSAGLANAIFSVERNRQLMISNANLEASQWEILNSRNTLRTFFDNIPTCVYIVDRSYTIMAINSRRSERISRAPNELVGGKCYEKLFGNSSPCALCRISEAFNGIPAVRNLREWGPNETFVHWEITTIPIREDPNQINRVIVFDEDITEKWILEANLIQSEKLASIGQLAATVAHEINNPLAAIIANAQLLLRDHAGADEDTRESLQLIETAGVRAAKIVGNLLESARRQRHEEFEEASLNQSILDALTMVQFEIKNRSIAIHLDLDERIPHIYANINQLKGVWLNLIINAMGAVETSNGTIHISTRYEKQEFRIMVTDNGKGITPENQNRIFEPFFTTKEAGKGTGLGLYVSHQVIKEHRGTIHFETKPGAGTKFIIILPDLERSGY
jgi:signal transduction histidine kinase